MIELREVRKIFHEGLPDELVAVDGVSLTIAARTLTVLRGPSGSGKTSLLSLVGGMARPTSGRIFVEGREITSLPERFLTALRRTTFGFVFQAPNLIRGLTALENVMLPAYPLGEPRGRIERRALALLESLGVAHRARARAEWLSGGEAQRAAVARALVNGPRVIIADEPTAHLDTKLTRDLVEILARLKAEGKTIVVASHDPLVCEAAVVDRAIDVRDGRVEAHGAPGAPADPSPQPSPGSAGRGGDRDPPPPADPSPLPSPRSAGRGGDPSTPAEDHSPSPPARAGGEGRGEGGRR